MGIKKITTAFVICIMLFTVIPINAEAGNMVKEETSSAIETREICHCGGTRLVSVVGKIESTNIPCPNQTPGCIYSLRSDRQYFHCTNPQCTDTWYGPVFRTYYMHTPT